MNSNGTQGSDKTSRRGFLDNPAEGAAMAFYLCIGAIGLFMVVDGATLHGPGHAAVGPGIFPMFIGAALLVLGLLAAIQVWRRLAPATEAGIVAGPVLRILAVMAAYIVGLWLVGFLVATPLMFAAALRVSGRRSPKSDLAVGIVIAVAAFLGFREGLGVHLPVGTAWLMLTPSFGG